MPTLLTDSNFIAGIDYDADPSGITPVAGASFLSISGDDTNTGLESDPLQPIRSLSLIDDQFPSQITFYVIGTGLYQGRV